MQPRMAAPAGNLGMIQQLAQIAANPYLGEGQRMVAQALIQQQMQGMDPMRQLQMQRLQMQIARDGQPQQPDPTSGMREYEMARSQGFDGSFLDYQMALADARRQQTTVNVGGEGQRMGTIPAGFAAVPDPENPSGFRLEPIPGGPAAQEAQQAEQQAVQRQQNRARAGATVVQDLQRALDLLPQLGAIAGSGGVVGGVTRTTQARLPGTIANRITQFTESALSNVGLDTLQAMREASPTGGALGQVPIQQQQRLEQVLGSLRIDQPPADLEANIQRVINIYNDIIYGSSDERERAVREGRMTPQQSAEIDSYYYDLPFDAQGRRLSPGAQPAPAPAPSGAVTPATIATMTREQMLDVDVMSLDAEAFEAYERRWNELRGGR
jgi:hypothetical protein